MSKISIFWHRRDLRFSDNAGLYHALKGAHPVLPLFIFDKDILDDLEDKKDARVNFIFDEVHKLHQAQTARGSSMIVRYGKPIEVWKQISKEFDIAAVYTNRDYEPYAKSRDKEVQQLLEKEQIHFHDYKDHVVFDRDEVLKDDGNPYTVFTPYSRKWKAKLDTHMVKGGKGESTSYYFQSYPNEKYFDNWLPIAPLPMLSLKEMGFDPSDIEIPPTEVPRKIIKSYDETRNFPAIDGTSRLGIHFRFGTISIREKARKAQGLNETYLNELIWRDFYSTILDHFPHVVGNAFRAKYDAIPWRDEPEEFQKWCAGKTGYPIVDAGMRELNATGYMHNRVRMITASFLTKHLLIDWRWGETYFAQKLLDFDLASNNGGWQWASGSGTDAAPYFRIFNPESQQKKFDKDYKYIKQWVPEFGTDEYVEPMVEHKFARERCLATYKEALG